MHARPSDLVPAFTHDTAPFATFVMSQVSFGLQPHCGERAQPSLGGVRVQVTAGSPPSGAGFPTPESVSVLPVVPLSLPPPPPPPVVGLYESSLLPPSPPPHAAASSTTPSAAITEEARRMR